MHYHLFTTSILLHNKPKIKGKNMDSKNVSIPKSASPATRPPTRYLLQFRNPSGKTWTAPCTNPSPISVSSSHSSPLPYPPSRRTSLPHCNTSNAPRHGNASKPRGSLHAARTGALTVASRCWTRPLLRTGGRGYSGRRRRRAPSSDARRVIGERGRRRG